MALQQTKDETFATMGRKAAQQKNTGDIQDSFCLVGRRCFQRELQILPYLAAAWSGTARNHRTGIGIPKHPISPTGDLF